RASLNSLLIMTVSESVMRSPLSAGACAVERHSALSAAAGGSLAHESFEDVVDEPLGGRRIVGLAGLEPGRVVEQRLEHLTAVDSGQDRELVALGVDARPALAH